MSKRRHFGSIRNTPGKTAPKKDETNQRKTASTKEKLEGVCFPVKAPLLVPCDPENYKENKLQHWSNMLP